MSQEFTYLFAVVLLLAAGLLILRVFVRRAYRQHGRLPWFWTAVQGLLFFTYGGFPALYLANDWPAVHVNRVQHAIGLVLLLAGLGILFYGMIQLGIGRSMGRSDRVLAQSRLYRRTRNPQALACGLYVLGFVLLWPSAYAIGWALLFPVLIHAMVLTEEEHLRRLHGEKYEIYCRQVPRYLGLSRRR